MSDELTRFLNRWLPGETYDTIAIIEREFRRMLAEAEERGRSLGVSADRLNKSDAQALGSRGGKKGGPARAAKMTSEERSECARKAATARWSRGAVAKATAQ